MNQLSAASDGTEPERRRLHVLVQELVAEVGPVDEEQVATFSAMLARVDAENARMAASVPRKVIRRRLEVATSGEAPDDDSARP